MRHSCRNFWRAAATILVLGACGEAAEGEDNEPAVVIDIQSDANRDGYVTADDNAGEDQWTVESGAAFLPNVDDDDGDGLRDAWDAVVNINPQTDADRYDLAPLKVQPWPDAPDGAVGWLSLDGLSLKHVRVFKLGSDGSWTLAAGSDGPCGEGGDYTCPYWNHIIELSTDEIRSGVEFGVEGRRFAGMIDSISYDAATETEVPWSGVVTFEYSVVEAGANAPIKSQENPDTGVDVVQMRVAPWVLFGNLSSKIDTVFANNVSAPFMSGIDAAIGASNSADADNQVNFWKIDNWQDHWTEDYFQTGFVSVPWADGNVHGMRVAMPRSWGRPPGNSNDPAYLPMQFLLDNHTYQDSGVVKVHRVDFSGDSYDSFGNHDLVPAYTNGDQSFPYGRIIHGSGVLQETKDFYAAQLVQAPTMVVNTSWLIVGHVDEVFSYVPANTDRGWKLLVGSATLAMELLQQWQSDGHGAVEMFVGKSWGGNKGPAAISIDDVLGDPDLMAWSQEAQGYMDEMLAHVKAEVGLSDDEIIPIPYLLEKDYGALVAYNPGTSNALVWHDYIVHPDPFGPSINGNDGFKKDLQDRLGTAINGLGKDGQGMKVHFTDDWDMYHRLLGEVHCGTNQEGPPAADVKWWGAMQ